MKVLRSDAWHSLQNTHTQNLLSLDEKKIGEGFSKERGLVWSWLANTGPQSCPVVLWGRAGAISDIQGIKSFRAPLPTPQLQFKALFWTSAGGVGDGWGQGASKAQGGRSVEGVCGRTRPYSPNSQPRLQETARVGKEG